MDNMENYEDVMETEDVMDDGFEGYESEESGISPLILLGAAAAGGAVVAVGSAVKKRFIDPKLGKLKAKLEEKKNKSDKEVIVVKEEDVEVIDAKVEGKK